MTGVLQPTLTSAPGGTRPRPRRASGARLLVGYAAVAGTVPYLALKVAWLAGSTVGLADPAFFDDPSVPVLNAVTAGMDAVAVLAALAFTHRFGQRLPAWLVLVPMWVGTGLLAPIALALPAAGLSGALAPAAGDPLQWWVRPMVYGGFAWQAVLLTAAFVLYARVRWPGAFRGTASSGGPGPLRGALVPLAAGAAALAVVAGALHLAWALGATVGLDAEAAAARDFGDFVVDGTFGLLALAAAAGVLAMVRGWRAAFWLAAAAAWVGAGALFSWGTWLVVNLLAGTVVAGVATALPGLLALVQAIAGLLLAVAALFLVAERLSTTRSEEEGV